MGRSHLIQRVVFYEQLVVIAVTVYSEKGLCDILSIYNVHVTCQSVLSCNSTTGSYRDYRNRNRSFFSSLSLQFNNAFIKSYCERHVTW